MKKFCLTTLLLMLLSVFFSPAWGESYDAKLYYAKPIDSSTQVDTRLYMTATGVAEVSRGVASVPAYAPMDMELKIISWDGFGVFHVTVRGGPSTVDASYCPQMNTKYWVCTAQMFRLEMSLTNRTCPWIMFTYITTTDLSGGGGTYQGPVDRASICSVPVDSFDISWSRDGIVHDKTLSLTADEGTQQLQATVSTYLMKDGHLCDGSTFDERGASCRFVASGITVTPLGCDQPNVATTRTRHDILDPVLDDFNLTIDTSMLGSGAFTAQCAFRYLIDEL